MQTEVETGQQESWQNHKELYPMEVGFDLQEMDAAGGISVVFDKKRHSMRVEGGTHPVHALAWGHFDDRIATTGWSELSVETTARQQVTSDVKMYGAGFAEGLLTSVRISDFYANTHKLLMRRESSVHALGAVKQLFQSEISFWKERANFGAASAEEPEDAYWKQARYILFQLWGVCDGYNFAAHHFGVNSLGLDDMLLLNSGADLAQLMEAYSPESIEQRALVQRTTALLQRATGAALGQPRAHKPLLTLGGALFARSQKSGAAAAEDQLDDAHWERRLASDGHCSALVRVADGRQELLVGHTTWDDYSRMTRIFKRYKFTLPGAAAKHIAFSSYPGAVSSTDDFYVTDTGLVAMDTSLEILDPAVWDAVPQFSVHPHLPNFAHVMITNRMANSASHWTTLFASSSSSASASQWMIVDYNKFEVGAPIGDNTLWVLEVIPGAMVMKDMSGYLRQHGFWPSFNRPFFDQVREASGHSAAERSHGALYSWSQNPRAKIFAAAAGRVNGAFDMRGLMSRNNAPGTSPGHQISARMDLSSALAMPNGGIDTKVLSHCLVKRMQVQAESGPSHGSRQPFRWRLADGTELWPDWPHVGLPDVWNFGFVQFSADGIGPLLDNGFC